MRFDPAAIAATADALRAAWRYRAPISSLPACLAKRDGSIAAALPGLRMSAFWSTAAVRSVGRSRVPPNVFAATADRESMVGAIMLTRSAPLAVGSIPRRIRAQARWELVIALSDRVVGIGLHGRWLAALVNSTRHAFEMACSGGHTRAPDLSACGPQILRTGTMGAAINANASSNAPATFGRIGIVDLMMGQR